MQRDEELINLRPTIVTDVEKDTSAIETFQNDSLRPILKFQNDFLIALIKNNNHYNELLVKINSEKDFLVFIKAFLNKETQLKQTIIGALIGFLTIEETSFYFNNLKELNKRIIQMTAQRFFDNNNF